jgi:serine/threonine-protein kinase
LLEPAGRSGLGVTFRALQIGSEKPVAVKVLRVPAGAQPQDLDQFTHITEALSRLAHPSCAAVFGGGIEGRVAWQAREWFPAGSLADLLTARGRLTEIETLEFAAQAASGLAAADAAGLPYCELKPSNFLFADAATVRVADFASWLFYERLADDVGIFSGVLFTTPPERLRHAREDVRSQIYAFGTVLFKVLTGVQVFSGETMIEAYFDLLEGPPLHLADFAAGLDENTVRLIERMLAANPEDRFQSWSEVGAAINAAGARHRSRAS